MRNKKIIAYKSERIRKIAYGFRHLLVQATIREWNRLHTKKGEKNESRPQRIAFEDEQRILYRTLEDSICICAGCNQIDRDMVYNNFLEQWYCTVCVQKYRDFYYENKVILDRNGFVGDFNEEFHESFL